MATSASCYSTSCHERALRSVIGSSGNTANSCNNNSENPTSSSSSFCERQTIPVVGNPTLGAGDKGGGGGDGDGIDVKEKVVAEVRDGVYLSRVRNHNNNNNYSLKKWKMNLKTYGTSIVDEKMVVNSDNVNNSIDSSDKNLKAKHAADVTSKTPQTQLNNNSKGDIHQQGGDLVSQMYNENTVKKTKSCLRKLTGFFKTKGESRPLEQIPSDRLDSLLCLFFKEARKLDGDEFEPMSLGAFQCALDRYLRQHKYPCDILSDHTFALSRGVLMARKKELRSRQLKKENERKTVHVNGDQQEILDCSVQFCDNLSDQKELVPDATIRKTNVKDPKRTVAEPKETEAEPITVPAQVPQNLEKVYESSSQPHMRNVLTVRKTISCVRRMTAFFFEKGEKRPVEQIPPNELDKLLCSFFREVKKLDGGEFEPMSLSAFQCALDRYLRDKSYPYNTLTDVDFALSRSVLNAKKKELKELSKGKRPNSSFELTQEEEDALWKEGVLGSLTNASSLQRTVWYFNRKLLGLKCNQESYELKWGDLHLKLDPLKGEYLVYNERIQKARSAPPLMSVSCPKSDGNNNNMCTIWPDQKRTERCPIRFYKEFAKHRPHSACLPDSPFYLSVKLKRMPDDQIFYKNCNLGIHSLEKMLKLINLPTNAEGTSNSASNSTDACEQHHQYQKMSQNLQDVPISKSHFVGGNGPTRDHPDPLPVRPMNMLQTTAGYAEAGPSNQGYSGKPENSRRKKIATATVSSETVLIPDDSPPQPTAPKLQKKTLDERRFDERRFDEQRFQERRFENRRFEERRQMVAAQSAQVAAPPMQVPTQMQVQQHLQVTAPPPAPAPPPPRQVQVLAPPVQVAVAKPKPVEKPRPREKRIFVVADHQRCVMSNLASLWKSGKLCDAGIGNGSSTVMVHKVVLSAVCPKLLSVFSTDILSHKFLQVNFPEEVSTEALNAFAEYMYNGILDLDRDILEQLKIIAKRLDMKEFEQLCDSHLPNHMHQPPAAAVTSYTNVPLIQTSMQFPSMTSSLPSLSSTISAPVQSAPAITTQVIDVKQEISEAELAQVRKDTAAVFGQESEVASLTPNKSGNAAGFVICPSVKTEPVGPEDDKYGRLSSNVNNQTFTSTVPSSSSSSLTAASTSITSVPASQTEFAIPFSETTDVKSTKLKSSHSYESPLVSDLSPVSCIVETVCSQSSHMTEDSSKPLSRQSITTSCVESPSTSTTSAGIYPVGLFTAGGDNLPLLTTQTVDVKSIDLYKTDLT